MSSYSFKEKIGWYLMCCVLMTITSCSSSKEDKKNEDVSEDEIKSLSETMGHLLFENLQTQHLNMNIDSLVKGIENANAGAAAPLSKQEFIELLSKYKNSLVKVQGQENNRIADDFLTENKQAQGIVSLNDGKIQYIILQEGDGKIVRENDSPLIEYEGKLLDGTVFDSTKLRGQPAMLPLKSTIPGFKMAVAGMKEGEKRKIFIHPELGYGTQGRLPPNSLLIFEVEIVKADGTKTSDDPNYRKLPDEEEERAKDNDSHEEDTGSRWLRKLKEAIF
jgi:peptidylprolyl isomerase